MSDCTISRGLAKHADVCRYCGSVLRDVWASWDFEKQQWVLADSLDHAHCCDCDNETSVEKVPEGQPFVPVSREVTFVRVSKEED
jgi:hypothetical protein